MLSLSFRTLIVLVLVTVTTVSAQLTPDATDVVRLGADPASAGILPFRVDFLNWPHTGLDVTDFAPVTALPGVTVDAVRRGRYIDLTGASNFLRIPNPVNAPTDALTFECWLRTTDNTGTIISYNNGSTGARLYNPNNLSFSANGGVDTLNSGVSVNDGQWHHVAARWSQPGTGNMRIYVDGVQVANSTSATSGNLPTGGDFYVAEFNSINLSDSLSGDFDDVRIWNVSRTNTQIANTMSRSQNGLNANLCLTLPLEEFEDLGVSGGGSDDLRDTTVNANHADLVGTATFGFTDQISNLFAYVDLNVPAAGACPETVGLDVLNDGTVLGFDGTPMSMPFSGGEVYTLTGGAPLTINVPTDFPTIQAAIDAAPCDNVIIAVAPGTYNEFDISFGGKAVTVSGTGGAAATIIDAQGLGMAFLIDADGVLEGVTVRNGSRSGGANVTADATIRNCIFENNLSVTLGGGLRLSGNCVVDSCRFIGNTGNLSGGAIASFSSNTDKVVVNCVFEDNTTLGSGGAIYQSNSGGLDIVHCTFTGNVSGSGGNAVHDPFGGSSAVRLINSIAWGNGANEVNGKVEVSHSNVLGGAPGVGNIDVNPLFADADLRLLACSPCINAGDPAAISLPTLDFDGNTRVLEGTPDMGAFEITSGQPNLHPGTGEDLTLDIAINGSGGPCNLIVAASTGDALSMSLASPGGTFDGTLPSILGQLFTPDAPLTPVFPGLLIDLFAPFPPFVIFDGATQGGLFGPLVLPAGGMTLQGFIPVGLEGFYILTQGLVTTSTAANSIFAGTDGVEIRIF